MCSCIECIGDQPEPTEAEWQARYLGTWVPTLREVALYKLATQYHAECEAFDRTVCTGPVINGSIMPATPREMATISRNAKEVLRRIVEQNEVSYPELLREIQRTA